MITTLVLRFLARDAASVASFFQSLSTHLDNLSAKHDADVAKAKADVTRIRDTAEQRAADVLAKAEAFAQTLRTEAEDEITTIENTITAKVKAAEILLGLKSALPTA